MSIARPPREILVVLLSPAPVAAALYRVTGRGRVAKEKIWNGGPRPRWVAAASRSRRTLLVDENLATLASTSDAGADALRLERLGNGISVSRMKGALVAFRAEAAKAALELAWDERILADCVTSAAAAILAQLPPTGDCGRLHWGRGGAILAARVSGKIALRRFATEEDLAELASTLRVLPPMRVLVTGRGESGLPETALPPHLKAEELAGGPDGSAGDLFESLAKAVFAGEAPALFAEAGRGWRCGALRLLPATVAALFLLTLAVIPPLYGAKLRLEGAELSRRESESELAAGRSRAVENRAILGRIDALAAENARISANAAVTTKEISRLLDLQDALESVGKVEVTVLGVDQSGRKVSLSGSVPRGAEARIRKLSERLGRTGLTLAGGVTLQAEGALVRFTMNLEARP
jgi:hypothetical protein